MASSTLTLGGFVFDDFSTPSTMMGGGKQAMVIHKLPGGARVIDTLGPDEENIIWEGMFYGNDAFTNAIIVDGMRAAGQIVPLTWGGLFRWVIIDNFVYKARREPIWFEYQISCTVYQNPSLGSLVPSIGTIDSLIVSDLSLALGL